MNLFRPAGRFVEFAINIHGSDLISIRLAEYASHTKLSGFQQIDVLTLIWLRSHMENARNWISCCVELAQWEQFRFSS